MLAFIDFWTRIIQTNVIIGMIVAIIGLGLALLAKKVVMSHKKVDYIEEKDTTVMVLRGFGIVLIFIGMLVMIIQ